MFLPRAVFYEEKAREYELGERLLREYEEKGIPLHIIENHNNIPEMREKQNVEFPKLKQNLIIGVRKTHKFVPNTKTSDFLVPYTSSGCTAMCMYCYLVCNYNKCSYLRLFVNREQMLEKVISTCNNSDKLLTMEIGSNSDLILENTITQNLEWTIPRFADHAKGFLTFPTKFDMVEPLLDLDHQRKVIIRMSVNPEEIIRKVEFGTSRLENRVKAINQLKEAGYQVGILIAPIILVEDWQKKYEELLIYLAENLSSKVKKDAFFELILMTYSYIHHAINQEAFPNAIHLYDKEKMKVRGRGKYAYNDMARKEAENFFLEKMKYYFPNNEVKYMV